MRKTTILSAILLVAMSFVAKAQDNPIGTVAYALPQTTLTFEVEAVQENFYAGPYAQYAQKYLGIEARLENESKFELSSVKLTPSVEADPSQRYVLSLSKESPLVSSYMQMTTQGLIATSEGASGDESVWRFPATTKADFSQKGVSSNYTSEATTLYRGVKDEDIYNKVSVQQNMVVEKSVERKAQEAADMIFRLRETRVQIITGDTDASYSGEAMAAAIEEIARLENEYLSLFIGYSEYQTQTMRFDVVPQNGESNISVAFRLSDTDGLVSADDVSGKPYFLDVNPQEIGGMPAVKTSAKAKQIIMYRVPAICNIRLTDGVKTILQTRLPVYQLGRDYSFPEF